MNSYAKLSNATEKLNAMMHERLTLNLPTKTNHLLTSLALNIYRAYFALFPPVPLNYFSS